MTGHSSTVWQLDFDAEGEHLASVSEDFSVKVWKIGETETKCIATNSQAHKRYVYGASFNRKNSSILASCGADNKICVFALKDGQTDNPQLELLFSKSSAHTSDVNAVAFRPNSEDLLVSVSDDQTVKLWRFKQ